MRDDLRTGRRDDTLVAPDMIGVFVRVDDRMYHADSLANQLHPQIGGRVDE